MQEVKAYVLWSRKDGFNGLIRLMKLYMSGRKIRYRDTRLLSDLFALKVAACLLLCAGPLLAWAWGNSKEGGVRFLKDVAAIPWQAWLAVMLAAVVLAAAANILGEYFFPVHARKMWHIQSLALLVVRGNLYEHKNKSSKKLMDTLGILESDSREEIGYFPKIFYRMKGDEIHITVEIAPGRLQEPLLNLQKDLESLLYCEMLGQEMFEGYARYTFLFDVRRNRIGIDDVTVENGSMRLMKGMYWQFDELPHALIVGGTGGGKTYFILTMIYQLLKSGAELSILDPKRSDLADLADFVPNVYCMKEQMMAEVNRFWEGMMGRTQKIKGMQGYQTGCNYRKVGLKPKFLIFDEYVAFMDMLGMSASQGLLDKLKNIIMLGRQVGCFIILACQRPDAKYFADGMRDQFHLRVALGRNSEMGYGMVFGTENKKRFYYKKDKGRGYIDIASGATTEFYAPFVPPGYDFLKNIKELGLEPTAVRGTEEREEGHGRVSYWWMEWEGSQDVEESPDVQGMLGDGSSEAPQTIREARRMAGLTQAEAGALFGADQGKVSKWENGKGTLPEDEAAMIQKILSCRDG